MRSRVQTGSCSRPSNPFISIDPILAVDGVREAIEARRDAVVAVTPIIAGAAVKGPLAEMLDSLGHERSAIGVARHLTGLASRFVLDRRDADRAGELEELQMQPIVAQALMHDEPSRLALAQAALR